MGIPHAVDTPGCSSKRSGTLHSQNRPLLARNPCDYGRDYGSATALEQIERKPRRLEAQGTTETLFFAPSVLPSRALPPFRAQVATIKPAKLWLVVALAIWGVSAYFPGPLHRSGAWTGAFELWLLGDLWLSARVSPLQVNADGVRISWHRTLRWNQIAHAEVWKFPVGTGYRVRLFDASNRKLGQIARLNYPAEWPLFLDYLRARAGY